MARLTVLVAGGTEESREALTNEIFDRLQINAKSGGPRVWVTEDDPDRIELTDLTSW